MIEGGTLGIKALPSTTPKPLTPDTHQALLIIGGVMIGLLPPIFP